MEIIFIQFILNLSESRKYKRLEYFMDYLYSCPESASGICNCTHCLTIVDYCYLAHSTCATLFATLTIVAILIVSQSVIQYLKFNENLYFLLPLICFAEPAVLALKCLIRFLGKTYKFHMSVSFPQKL